VTDEPLRVLIADDHPVYRHGLCALLDTVADIDVVGEAATGGETVAAASCLEPHVVVMDLYMPAGSRVEATTGILRILPATGVLILTMDHDDDLVFAAVRAGARGYLLKETSGSDIIRALRAVARGEAVFGPRVADRVLNFFAAPLGGGAAPFPRLTNREREVLDLVARGLGNHAIARRLTLAEKTVRNASPTSWPSCTYPAGPRPSPLPATPASAPGTEYGAPGNPGHRLLSPGTPGQGTSSSP